MPFLKIYSEFIIDETQRIKKSGRGKPSVDS